LGGGFNTIFSDSKEYIDCFILHIKNKGIKKIHEDIDSISFEVKAGEDWDTLVSFSTNLNLSGIEALSHIPSSVGATPVQNVGAYGQEVCQSIQSVHVFDTQECVWKNISASMCGFGYRTSIFKKEQKGRYIIESVVFKLLKQNVYIPQHAELKKYLGVHNLGNSPQEIRDAVILIRTSKLPDPKINPNCGSFFENTILNIEELSHILKKHPHIPQYPEKDGRIKVSTGWMIDTCGLKGFTFGHISVSKTNALVLIHDGNGTYEELDMLQRHIITKVKNEFGITIQREPNIIY
jgi:UDP-N-acetylmuramate dehydrogenase